MPKTKEIQLTKSLPHYHFIGIGGIGMSGLAYLALKKGYRVTGSDLFISPLIEKLIKDGAVVYRGQDSSHVAQDATVVYSSDIPLDNLEILAAKSLNCPVIHRSLFLAQLASAHHSFAVAGSHGKTTTSALLASVFFESGQDPSFVIGGILPAFGLNAYKGSSNTFVFEADESDGSFLNYHPDSAIITNIDHDHLINYGGSEDQLAAAFKRFISQVSMQNFVFWNGDDRFLNQMDLSGPSYGFEEKNDWQIYAYRQEGFRIWFNLRHQNLEFKDIELALCGRHNAANGAAVFALAFSFGIAEEGIREAFKSFKGTLRRCERKGALDGTIFIDDYAHHPTEIRSTLAAIRAGINHQRLLAVFQPHRYTRIKDCMGMFGSAFQGADEVIITDIFAAGENEIEGVSAQHILQELKDAGLSCRFVPRSALVPFLTRMQSTFDVLVTLGAGDITKVCAEVMCLMEKKHPIF